MQATYASRDVGCRQPSYQSVAKASTVPSHRRALVVCSGASTVVNMILFRI